MSQADRDKLDRAKHLAKLAGPYAEEIVETAVEVMRDRDPRNRQRLNAAAFLAELIQEGDASEKGGGAVKVLVVRDTDIARLSELQRQERVQATVVDKP